MLVCAIMMHAVKQNSTIVGLYAIQSLAVTGLLALFAFREAGSVGLLLSAALTLVVKVIVAPRLFLRLIARHQLKRSGSAYLNLPLTLLVLLVLMATIQSDRFVPLMALSPLLPQATLISISSLLASFFLLVNRKGVLSQMIGVLALENSIVALATQMGIEQTISLELGIAFDILVWIIVASTFITLIYRHFGSLDSTAMKHLTE